MSALHTEQAEGCLRLRIDGSITIAEVTPLRVEMLAVLTEPIQPVQAVVIDLQGVGEADSAGVQLLLSASAWLEALKIQPLLAGVSTSLDQVARAIGAADDAQCCGFARRAAPEVSS